MSECNCATVDVDSVHVGVQLALPGQHHGGEGLVDLEEIDLLELEPGLLEHALGGRDGPGQHDGRIHAGQGGGHEARARREPKGLGAGLGHDEERGGAVGDLRRVACRHHTVRLEGGLERGELLPVDGHAHALVGVEDAAVG